MKTEKLTLFAVRLKQLRIKAGYLTRYALARASGISEPSLGSYEKGKVVPSWTTVVRLAEVLGVSTEAFNRKAIEE